MPTCSLSISSIYALLSGHRLLISLLSKQSSLMPFNNVSLALPGRTAKAGRTTAWLNVAALPLLWALLLLSGAGALPLGPCCSAASKHALSARHNCSWCPCWPHDVGPCCLEAEPAASEHSGRSGRSGASNVVGSGPSPSPLWHIDLLWGFMT